MPARVLHVLAQRPSRTGSGVTLDALVRAADARAGGRYEQAVLVGTPAGDPTPDVGGLAAELVHALTFDDGTGAAADVPFPVPGMSDVMPYPSSVWSALTSEQLARYRAAWRRKVATLVGSFAPDLIHVHHTWLVAAGLKDAAPDVPVVMHAHGTGLGQLARCPHLALEVRAGCARNERLCVLHEAHAERYATELGYPRERIRVVGAGFREDLFHERGRRADGDLILYAGKLSRAKGLPWLLDAFEALRARRPAARLELAGGGAGAESDALRERIASIEGCRALGELTASELADRMRRAAVFVLPSLAEGLPLVLVEAAAAGCRLVASDLPGTRALAATLGERLRRVPGAPATEDGADARGGLRFSAALGGELERSLAAGSVGDAEPGPDRTGLEAFRWASVLARIEAVWNELGSTSDPT